MLLIKLVFRRVVLKAYQSSLVSWYYHSTRVKFLQSALPSFARDLAPKSISLVVSRSTMLTSPHCYGIIQRGMSTLICVFFVRRVDDNDSAWDVLGHLSHMPSDSRDLGWNSRYLQWKKGQAKTVSSNQSRILRPVEVMPPFHFAFCLPNSVLLYALRPSPVVQRDDAHYSRARSMVSYECSFRDVGESHA